MKNKVRSNESLCEKSMKMVTNMVKLSSFSISNVSLGIITGPLPVPATKNLASVAAASVMVVDKPPLLQFTGNRRSQEPRSGTKPMGYLIEPVAGNGSSSIITDNSVDWKAEDYIEKVHEKNRFALSNETTDHSAYIMPPPPRVVKK